LYRAATELFVKLGYRGVDVVDITSRCGVSPGTFYNYYRNKRDLLDVILERTIDGLVSAASGAGDVSTLVDRDAFVAEFEARAYAVLDHVANNAEVVSFVAFVAPGLDEAAYRTIFHGYQELGAQFAALLSTGRRRGWVREDVDVQIAGQVVVSCLAMAVMPMKDGATAEPFDAREVAAACSSYLLFGGRTLLPE